MGTDRRGIWPIGLVVALAAGAALRFSTLHLQSFWLDEAVTHQLVTQTLGSMLRTIPHSESTPPLYYVLAWAWRHLFGAGEVALRSLSALAGTATIGVLALIARRAAGDRAAIAAAALAAANPLLIWYSQEARAYALLVLLCALSVWCLQRRDWLGWAIAAAGALATHYFAVFIVAPELVWLVRWRLRAMRCSGRSDRGLTLAACAVIAVGAALLPLAITQAGGDRAAFIRSTGLGGRIAAVPKQFLIGYATPHQAVLAIVAAVLALALAISLRRSERELLILLAAAAVLPGLLALAGADYLITRNVIAAMVPLVVLGGIAASRTRAGPALIGGLCAVGVIAFAGVEADARYQRDDWRGVAAALGPARLGVRAVIVQPASGAPALEVYSGLRPQPPGVGLSTAEIDIVDLAHDPPPLALGAIAGFHPCAVVRTPEYDVARYCAPVAVAEPYGELNNVRLVKPGDEAAVLIGR